MSLKKTIMRLFDYTNEEADDAITLAKQEMEEYLSEGDQESAYNICEEHFGLEPDYLMYLI